MSSLPPEQVIIAAGRKSDPWVRAIPGSQERACATCGHAVIVAPSTLAMMRTLDRIECLECVAAQARLPDSDLRFEPLNAAQLDELRQAGLPIS